MDSGDTEWSGTAVEPVGEEGVEFHESTGTYRTHFADDDRLAVEAVISAVSAATGVDAMELPPLYDVVDPDALCALVGPRTGGSGRFRGTVTFAFADSLVTVDGRGTIEVDPFGRAPPGDDR